MIFIKFHKGKVSSIPEKKQLHTLLRKACILILKYTLKTLPTSLLCTSVDIVCVCVVVYILYTTFLERLMSINVQLGRNTGTLPTSKNGA